MNLSNRIAKLESEIEVEEDGDRQGLVVACPVDRDEAHRPPGVYRRDDGWIETIVYPDDEIGVEPLLDTVRDELSDDILVVVLGPDHVLPPLDEMLAPRG